MSVVGCRGGTGVQNCEALVGAGDEGAVPRSIDELSTAAVGDSGAGLCSEKAAGVGGQWGERGPKDSDNEEAAITDAEAESKGSASPSSLERRPDENDGKGEETLSNDVLPHIHNRAVPDATVGHAVVGGAARSSPTGVLNVPARPNNPPSPTPDNGAEAADARRSPLRELGAGIVGDTRRGNGVVGSSDAKGRIYQERRQPAVGRERSMFEASDVNGRSTRGGPELEAVADSLENNHQGGKDDDRASDDTFVDAAKKRSEEMSAGILGGRGGGGGSVGSEGASQDNCSAAPEVPGWLSNDTERESGRRNEADQDDRDLRGSSASVATLEQEDDYRCPLCSERFTTDGELVGHVEICVAQSVTDAAAKGNSYSGTAAAECARGMDEAGEDTSGGKLAEAKGREPGGGGGAAAGGGEAVNEEEETARTAAEVLGGADPERAATAGNGYAVQGRGAGGLGFCPLCDKTFPTAELPSHADDCASAMERRVREEEERKEAEEKRQFRSQRRARLIVSKSQGASEIDPSIGGGGGGRRCTPADLNNIKPEPSSSDAGPGAVKAKDTGKRKSRFAEARAVPVANGAGIGAAGNELEGAGAEVRAAVGGVNFSSSCGKGKGKAKEARAGDETGGRRRRVPKQSTFECPKKMRGVPKMKGCGAMNSRKAQRCEKCGLILWQPWRGGKLRLGDEVLFDANDGQPEPGFVHSYLFDQSLGTMLTFTYKNYPGYAVVDLSLELLRPVPQRREGASGDNSGAASNRDESATRGVKRPSDRLPRPTSKKLKRSGSLGSDGARESKRLPTARCLKDFEALICQHVKSGEMRNHSAGKCWRCHKAEKASRLNSPRKRAEERPTDTGARSSPGWSSSSSSGNELSPTGAREHFRFPINNRRAAEDVVSSDRTSSNSRVSSNVKSGSSGNTGSNSGDDSNSHGERSSSTSHSNVSTTDTGAAAAKKVCETLGCDGQQRQLGLCALCLPGYNLRMEAKREEARELERALAADPDPPSCRSCEGLLQDSPLWECIRQANVEAAAHAGLLALEGDEDFIASSVRGTCYLCYEEGGKGPDNQLLICDGQDCPVSMHMLCLKEPLKKVPRRWWFCGTCVATGVDVRSQSGCVACLGRDNDDEALLCDICNDPWHMQCLPVPLGAAPEGNWFCPRCRDAPHFGVNGPAEPGAGAAERARNATQHRVKEKEWKGGRKVRPRTAADRKRVGDASLPCDLCDSSSCKGGRRSPPAAKIHRATVAKSCAAVGTAAALAGGGLEAGGIGAPPGAGVGLSAAGKAGGGNPYRMTALPWTTEDEENARWTCDSAICRGKRSFHKKCLLRWPAPACARGVRGASQTAAAGGERKTAARSAADGGGAVGVRTGAGGGVGTTDNAARNPTDVSDSGDDAETETDEDASALCGGRGKRDTRRTSENRAGSSSRSAAAAVTGGDDAVPVEVVSDRRDADRLPTVIQRDRSEHAPLGIEFQPEQARASRSRSPTLKKEAAPPNDGGNGCGKNGGQSTPLPPTRDLQSLVDPVLRPPGSNRENHSATALAAGDKDDPRGSVTRETGGGGCAGAGGESSDAGGDAFGSLEREFELEGQAAATTTSAAISASIASAAVATTAGGVGSPAGAPPPAAGASENNSATDGESSARSAVSSAAAESESGSWTGGRDRGESEAEMDLVCPLCRDVVATPEQVATVTHERVRFRGYTAALGRAFRRGFPHRSCREGVECSDGVKGAKNAGGNKAFMYGSICDQAVDCILRDCEVKKTDRFLDIGSGIGQVVMQAAACVGCYAVGVEIVPHRHKVAKQLLEALIVEADTETDPRSEGVKLLDNDALGRARLLEGNFVDMWDSIKDCNVMYLNNYGRWFKFDDPEKAEQCSEAQLIRLLQALYHPVTLITMAPLFREPLTWTRRDRRSALGERVATYLNTTYLDFHVYTTHHGQWACPQCTEPNDDNVDMCRWCGFCTRNTRSGGRT